MRTRDLNGGDLTVLPLRGSLKAQVSTSYGALGFWNRPGRFRRMNNMIMMATPFSSVGISKALDGISGLNGNFG